MYRFVEGKLSCRSTSSVTLLWGGKSSFLGWQLPPCTTLVAMPLNTYTVMLSKLSLFITWLLQTHLISRTHPTYQLHYWYLKISLPFKNSLSHCMNTLIVETPVYTEYWSLICSLLCRCKNKWHFSMLKWAEPTAYISWYQMPFHQNFIL